MKKILIVLVISLMIMGCGNNDLKTLDIKLASNAAEKSLSNMKDVDVSTLTDVYGLDLSLISDYVVKQNDDGDMYAILHVKDKNAVKTNMKEYFRKVKEFNTAYSPERLEILEDRLEKEIGEYLIYIISKDSQDTYTDIIETIK